MAPRPHDPTRVEAFSDGVFAFSATLLVVSLEVPTSFPELVANLYGFVPFVLTFGALVAIWSVHRAFFARYGVADGRLVALNAALLFVVLFYVYPLKYLAQVFVVFVGAVPAEASAVTIGSRDELGTLFVLYGAGFAALFAVVALMHRHVARRADALGLSPLQRHDARWIGRHYALFVLAGGASIAVALAEFGLEWGAPGYAYALLGPACYVNGKRAEQHGPT